MDNVVTSKNGVPIRLTDERWAHITDNNFDFAIPPSEQRPERLLRAINVPSRDTITAYCFAWGDVSQERAPGAQAYAVLNDQERSVSNDLLRALEIYQIQPLLWKNREQYVEALVS